MVYFDTPSWDEEKEAEKSISELFSTPNVIRKKIPKKRKRNKYPAGFKRSTDPQSFNRLKDNPVLLEKENLKKITQSSANEGSSLLHKKNKKHKKPKTDDDVEENSSNKKRKKATKIEQEHLTNLSLTKKKKKSRTNNNIFNQMSKSNKSESKNVPISDLKNDAEKECSYQSNHKSVTTETVNEVSNGSPRILKKKKKRMKKSGTSAEKDEIFDTCNSKVNNDSQNVSDQKKKQNDDSHDVKRKSAEKCEVLDECNSKLRIKSQDIFGRKRKQNEDDQVIKKKKKKKGESKNVNAEYEEHSSHLTFEKTEEQENNSEEHVSSLQDKISNDKKSISESSSPHTKKTISLRERMEAKLRVAKFRFLNEQMYTSRSKDINKYFLIDQKAFEVYHKGYNRQLMQWPVKPIDLIIKSLKKKPKDLVIADFGCGDAKIAQSLPNKVYSFDHVALNNHVSVCDMAQTPLEKLSVDVVVFCLSLMGSNLSDYISEANRVLKIGGILKIAEVESRFDDVDKFVRLIKKFGFLCTHQNKNNDYFYLFDFIKTKNLKEGKSLPSIELRTCVYKKR